jgi:hypothetical protein
MSEIQRPKVCSVSLEERYKPDWWNGCRYICQWVAVCRGLLVDQSTWFRDYYATEVELRGRFALARYSRRIQQKLIDQTRELSANCYWKLIERLEKKGWQPVYSNDGGANSMVKTSLPKAEPIKPKKWGQR